MALLPAGTYTVGTLGDYATWEAAFLAFGGGVGGKVTLMQISDVTITTGANIVIPVDAVDQLEITSNKEHKGVEADAWKTYVNCGLNVNLFNTGNFIEVEMHNLWFEIQNIFSTSTHLVTIQTTNGGVTKTANHKIHDNVFNMGNLGATALALNTGSGAAPFDTTYHVWNNLIYNGKGQAGALLSQIEFKERNGLNSTTIVVENNTIYGEGNGVVADGVTPITVRNNAFFDTGGIYDCFTFGVPANCESYNNISSDDTSDDATTQSGNIINAIAADEFESLVAGSDFLKPKATGNAHDGGTPISIPENIAGLGGNQRPWKDKVNQTTGYSVGAYESISTFLPPVPIPVTIEELYAQVKVRISDVSGYLSLFNGGIRALLYSYGGELRVFETNKCFKLSVNPEQGKNWSEYGGVGWLWPEANVSAVRVFSEKDQPMTIVMDAATGLFYRLSPRTGPAGSGITKLFKDKVGGEYSPGESIAWILRLKEHTASSERELVKHSETHAFVRPENENNQGASGYDANGYLSGQEITIKAYENGKVTESAKAENIPYKGDVVFDKKVENNRVQIEISGTESALKVVGAQTAYIMEDQRGAPSERIMEEGDYQLEMSEPIHWLSRGLDQTRDRASDSEPDSGSIFGASDGPDGESNSAMFFSPTSSLSYGNTTPINGDFTFQFAIKDIYTTTEVIRLANDGIIRIVVTGDEYEIEYEDSSGIYPQPMTWDGGDWVFVKVTRDGMTLNFSENGARLNSQALAGLSVLSGDIQYLTGNEKDLFDPRVYNENISDGAFSYYRNDVLTNNGNAFLCY